MLLVATVVSILAVDFPLIFPRNLCKTEEFGVSLVRLPYKVNYLIDGCWCRLSHVFSWPHSEED